jgi:hypothetical protein
MLFDDDVYDAIYYVHVNFMNDLNVIDDDVYDVTHCENEEINECLNAIRMMLDIMQSIWVNDNLVNGCRN